MYRFLLALTLFGTSAITPHTWGQDFCPDCGTSYPPATLIGTSPVVSYPEVAYPDVAYSEVAYPEVAVTEYESPVVTQWSETPSSQFGTITPAPLANVSYASYAPQTTATSPVITQASFQSYVPSTPVRSMASDALSIVNQKRSRRGLTPLAFDPGLTNVAQYKSQIRANRRLTGHDGSSMGGARAEGVGFAYGMSNLQSQFNTCHLYSSGYRYAGAAIAYDGQGRAYYTLLLR